MKEDLNNYRWTYYPQTGQGYLKLKNGDISNTLVLVEASVMIDRDKEGNILGVEILLPKSN